MIRVTVVFASALLVGGAMVIGCGSDDSAAGSTSDAGTSFPDAAPFEDADVPAPDAGCAHVGDDGFDAGDTTTVDGGGQPLVFFDVGGLDRQIDLSADGKIALLQDAMSGAGDVYFYDTVTGTLTKKTMTGDPQLTLATALSADGTHVSAFHGKDTIVAGVWDACGGWTDAVHTGGCIGDPQSGNPNTETSAFAVNKDGTAIVGSAWNGCATVSGMLWKRAGAAWTAVPLQHLGIAGGNNRASVVSDDGNVIGGFVQSEAADRGPAIWKSDGTGVALDPSGLVVGEVLSISGDGKMVAGPWNETENGGFYWTEADGVVKIAALPEAAPQDQMWLNAIAGTEAKRMIFGSAGDATWASGGLGSMQAAVVWTKANGLRKVQDIVVEKGIAVPENWYLSNVLAASADGSVLLGFAMDISGLQPVFHTFVLRLESSSY